MKRKTMSQAALLIGVALIGVRTIAATLYWDADGDPSNNNLDGTGLGASGLGTTGSWHSANCWWDGVSTTNQAWIANSDAVFAGLKGRIQLGADVTASSLQFNVVGYIIDVCPTAGANIGGNHLTANGVGGENAEILNSSVFGTSAIRTFTLNIASGTTSWDGRIYSGRLGFTKGGAGTLTSTNRIGVTSAWGQPGFNVTGGRLNLIGNAGCNSDGCGFGVGSGAVLDAGDNAFSARSWTVSYGGTLTTTGSGASITHSSSFDRGAAWGLLSGPLTVRFANNGQATSIHILAATNNSYSGGTLLNSSINGTCDVRVQADSATGSGRVRIENPGASNTSKISFQSPAPSIGSLESSSIGVKQVFLGCSAVTLASGSLKATWTSGQNTLTVTASPSANYTSVLAVGQVVTSAAGNGIPPGATITEITSQTTFKISTNATVTKASGVAIGVTANNTTLSVGALDRASDSFGGVITQALGTVGSVTKIGTGTWTLSGTNTYNGTTRIENGTLSLVKKSGFVSGTLKYTSVSNSAVITITTGSSSLLAPGQVVSGANIPANAVVSLIDGSLVTLTVPATAAGTTKDLTAYAMDGSLASGDIDVLGGTLNGSGTIGFRLDSTTDGIIMTSGALDLTSLAINFTGTPTEKIYTLVDYSAGGSATFATNPSTADSFASATNIPAYYKIRHDTTAKLVTLQAIPRPTMILFF